MLEQHLQELAEAHVTNTAVFGQGFESTDRRLFVLMRIQEEQLLCPNAIYYRNGKGGRFDPTDGYLPVGIDWMRYFAEYEAIQALAKWVERLNPMQEKTVDETVEELGTTVFGGDSA